MSEVNSGKAVESLKGVTSIDDLARQVEDLRKKVENIKPGADDRVSIIAFSGDLDKILAAFIIATGAVAMGMEAVMFFAFFLGTRRKKLVEKISWVRCLVLCFLKGGMQLSYRR